MATYDTARNYTSTFLGLATQLGISSAISLYCLLQFEWNRRKKTMQYLYSPRTRLSKNASPPIPPGLFSWIKATIFLPDEFYLTNVGLDALMYIRFLKMAFQFLLFNSLIVGIILIPINYTAGGSEDGVTTLSINNIPVNHTRPLWAHMICTYLVSFSWMYLIYINYYDYMKLHQEHILKKVVNDPITARTVMISRIPRDLRSEEKLHEFIDGLGLGPVESTRIVRHTGKLDRKIHRREKALLSLEKAHIQLAKNVCNTIKGRKLFGIGFWQRLFGYNNNENSQFILDAGEIKEHQRVQSLIEWLNPRKKKSVNNQNNSSEQNNNITKHFTNPSDNIMNQEDGYGRQFIIWDSLAHIPKSVLDKFQPTSRLGFMRSGKPVRSIDYFLRKFNGLDKRIAELRAAMPFNSSNGPYKPTGTGFVTFRDHISAQICAQSIISSAPHTCTTRMAPEPRDLLWENLVMRFRENMVRYIIVNACVWALIIFWLFPIFAFLTLTSIDSLSQRITFLGPFLAATPIIRTMLQNVLPTVLVSFFMAILPWILMEISKQECFPSYSELEEAVLVRFYHFSFFNVFIVFLLGITFLQSIFDVISNPTNIIELLATSLPKGATFFINYVIFNICTHGLELIQVGSQINLHIVLTTKWISSTPRMLKRVTNPWPFQFYFYYPYHILVLVITITYSTINPLILIFALLYYGVALVVFKHQFAYCYVRRYEAGGKFYRRVVRYTTDGLIIFQLTVLGVIWLRRAITQGALIVPLIIATGYFKYYCHKTFYSRTNYLALDTRLKQKTDQENQSHIVKENQSADPFEDSNLSKNELNQNFTLKINEINNLNGNVSSQITETVVGNISDSESSTKFNSLTNMYSKNIEEVQTQSSTNLIQKISTNKAESEKNSDYGSATQQVQSPSIKNLETTVTFLSPNDQHQTSLVILPTELTNEITEEKVESDSSTSRSVLKKNLPKLTIVPPNLDRKIQVMTASPVSCPDLGNNLRTPFRGSRSAYPVILEYHPCETELQDEASQYQTYTHPNLVRALNRRLWLPKNPLKKITIEDTVELSKSLTSSEGGSGIVGYWGEASTYLFEAKVSMYGIHEFPSPQHQRGATSSTNGEVFCPNNKEKIISNGSSEHHDDDDNDDNVCGERLEEFFSNEIIEMDSKVSSGEEY